MNPNSQTQKKMFKFNINSSTTKAPISTVEKSPATRSQYGFMNSTQNLPKISGAGVKISELNRMSPTPSMYNKVQ